MFAAYIAGVRTGQIRAAGITLHASYVAPRDPTFQSKRSPNAMSALGRNRSIAERRTNGRFPASHAPDLLFRYRPSLALRLGAAGAGEWSGAAGGI
jgi:hypothetical protein